MPQPNDPRPLTADRIVGRYSQDNPENDYHEGVIEAVAAAPGQPATLLWRNKSAVEWRLVPNLEKGELTTGDDNPYWNDHPDNGRVFRLVQPKSPDGTLRPEVTGFYFLDEFYRRQN